MSAAERGKTEREESMNNPFAHLSLGQIQLLLLGLWVIGEENRVDFKLMAEYRQMLTQLPCAAQTKIGR